MTLEATADTESLAGVLDLMGHGVAYFGADGRLTLWNKTFQALGPGPDIPLEQSMFYLDIFRRALAVGRFPDIVGREEQWLRERDRPNDEQAHTFEYLTNEQRWARWTQYRKQDGGLVCGCVDITDSKNSERDAHQTYDLLNAVIDFLPAQLTIKNERGQYIFANKAVVENIDIPKEQLIGHTAEEVFGAETAAILSKLDGDAICHPGDVIEGVELLETPKFGERHVRCLKRAWPRADGRIYVLAIMEDVTQQRQAEAERKSLERQLYHAQRLDSLGTLAGGIAHDLNNTLVPILGLTEAILKGGADDDPNRPLLKVIHQAGIHARDLVKQILSFSRSETLYNRPVDIAPFMQEALRLIRASVPTTIKIEQHIEKASQIFGDPGQLRQVIVNLVTNAAQAIGEQGGTIVIEAANGHAKPLAGQPSDLDSFVRISVSDTGNGMDEEIQRRIFEPFFTTKKVGEGTGLGLSIVRGIVAAHGGHITVSSKVGHGTRFDVFLPALQEGLVAPSKA
jgi:signal transduction histidine kinase